jgi:hypothetical protein
VPDNVDNAFTDNDEALSPAPAIPTAPVAGLTMKLLVVYSDIAVAVALLALTNTG